MGVSALIRTSFEEAARYRDAWARYNALSKRQQRREVPPRRDLRLDALVEVLEGKRGIHAHSYRADEILMLIRLADELGIHISTFQHVLEGYRVADEMAAHGAAGSTFSDWWSFKLEAFNAIPYNAALMRARGVLTSLNSDNANLARYLNIEAAKTVRYGGLAPADALALVTINPAKQLGIDDRVGSLEAGKDADLVIWSGDPLSVYSVADETFVDGRRRFSRALDRAHRAEVEAARQALLGELRGDEASSSDDAGKSDAEPAATPLPVVLPEYRYAPDHTAGPIAITGAMVHTLEGPAIVNGVVVMANGRITAVGGPATPVPAGAERVVAAGKHLWPAMIHTNTILGVNEIDSIPASSDIAETGDINADADVVVAVNAASTHFPVVRSAGISHAVIVPAGGMVSGTTAVLRTDGWTWEEMAAVERHGLSLRWPDPIPARYAGLIGMDKTPAERRKESDELVKRIEKLLDAAAAYGLAGPDADFDPQLHALQPVLRGERPLWAWAREKHAIEAAVGLARKRGMRVVIVGGRDAYLLTDLLAENRVPVVLTDITAEPPRHDDPYDVLYTMPAKLEAAGVVFALANGTRAGGSANGRQITVLAGIAAAHGLDREAAYRSVTTYPAKILGLDNRLGTIAAGKSASLILTDGDLLEQTTTVEQVWIDGQAADMDDVQKAAYRHWSSRPLPDES